MTWDEYLDMDIQEVTNAMLMSGMTKEQADLVWIKKRKAFEAIKD